MEMLARSLSQYAPEILLAVLAMNLALLAFLALLWVRLNRLQSRWNSLLRESGGENLEELLTRHLEQRITDKEALDEARAQIRELATASGTAKRHLGLVRFDAFEDVTGEQSFALAIYDDRGDGAVITSLVSRSGCRVYCKSLHRGRPDRSLSQEERRAVDEASLAGPKAIIRS
jgi:hypothetical protein